MPELGTINSHNPKQGVRLELIKGPSPVYSREGRERTGGDKRGSLISSSPVLRRFICFLFVCLFVSAQGSRHQLSPLAGSIPCG